MAAETPATTTTVTAASIVPRVSQHFPRVPAGCEKVAETFFTCFYDNGKPSKEAPDAEIGNKALSKCEVPLAAYNLCVDKAVEKAPKKLFRVPEAYRVREE